MVQRIKQQQRREKQRRTAGEQQQKGKMAWHAAAVAVFAADAAHDAAAAAAERSLLHSLVYIVSLMKERLRPFSLQVLVAGVLPAILSLAIHVVCV